jgi:lysophospholipase L1-like esterase
MIQPRQFLKLAALCASLARLGFGADPGLPRVLLIGDSISGGYGPVVRELLKGKADVQGVQRRERNGATESGLREIDSWLGDSKWALIHFNWGLWDVRIDAEGRNMTPVEHYGGNLRRLVDRMKQTQAKLVFATTTPVPESVIGPKRLDRDVVLYNGVARKVMEEGGVSINDLYRFMLPRLAEFQGPTDVHFTPEGYQLLGKRVAASIAFVLGLDTPAK